MAKSENRNGHKEVKERVWKALTAGLDSEHDPCGYIDDIKDNTSYAIDIAIFETAAAILHDIEKADEPQNRAVLVWLKKKWLVPVPKPELNIPEILVPDWIYETPAGKWAAKEADEIVMSFIKHQHKKMEDNKCKKKRV